MVIEVKVCGPKGEVKLKALVDTGLHGDLITLPVNIEATGIELKYERVRRLPDGRIIKVRYGGGEIHVIDSVTYGDIEVWEELKLPSGIDALLGVTALEKLGYRIDARTGRLNKVELYLL